MSNELQIDYLTDKTVYFLLRDSTSLIWDGADFVSYSGGTYASYKISGTEQGSGGFYVASMPSVAAALYSVVAKEQAGGSPAETDFSIGWGNLAWNGSAVPPPAFSGQQTSLLSGSLSGQIVSVHSGTLYPASGRTFIASGPFAHVPPSTISGVVANSGIFANVPKSTLSGIIANSGLFVNALLLNDVTHGGDTATLLLSKLTLENSGGDALSITTTDSFGINITTSVINSGSADGVNITAGGNGVGLNTTVGTSTRTSLSGVNSVVPTSSISGVVANSGIFVSVPKATLSGVVANSGLFVTLPKETISGVVANSGLNVNATASVASGDVYLASGTLSVEIPRYLLRADVSGFQSGAARNSLLGAALKLTSKFDVGSGSSGVSTVYETDGTTVFMTQGKTTNTNLKPVQILDVGE